MTNSNSLMNILISPTEYGEGMAVRYSSRKALTTGMPSPGMMLGYMATASAVNRRAEVGIRRSFFILSTTS